MLKQNANEGCHSCASLAGLVLSFIACLLHVLFYLWSLLKRWPAVGVDSSMHDVLSMHPVSDTSVCVSIWHDTNVIQTVYIAFHVSTCHPSFHIYTVTILHQPFVSHSTNACANMFSFRSIISLHSALQSYSFPSVFSPRCSISYAASRITLSSPTSGGQ